MLKSVFNLVPGGDEEEAKEEEVPEDNPDAVAEEEKVYPERTLDRSEICGRLSMLGLSADGEGYTYVKGSFVGMRLTDINAICHFKHLQFVDVSNNNLELEALQAITKLQYLVLLQADKNLLTSAGLKRMKFLQVMIMNNNKLTSVFDVFQPEMSTLEVGDNKIQKIAFENRMPTIRCLDFRNNNIQDILDLDFPILDSLYLAGNKITSLVGLEKLVNLRILHVRNNPIKSLNGFDAALAKLQYINLRNCKVASLKQVRKLALLPSLETLVMRGCPYMGGAGTEEADADNKEEEDESELRVEVLAALPRLKRLNKSAFTPEERAEAKEMMAQWLEEGIKDDEEDSAEEQQEEEDTHHED